MTKKLISIKNFLRIIISLFVIINMAKSCAKAVTNISLAQAEEINANIQKVANYYGITNYPVYNANGNISKDSSNLYCIYITESNSGWQANTIGAFFPQYDILTTTYNGSNYLNNIRTTVKNINTNSNVSISDWAITKNARFKYLYTQFNWSSATGFNYKANNEYGAEIIFAPEVNIYFGHLFSTTITYNGEEMQACELNYNYRATFVENVITEENEITSMQATLDNITLECNNLGSYWDLVCPNSTLLKYNQVYNLTVSAIVNGNEEEIEEKVIFVPPGTTISGGVITNIPSGDYGFSTENATNQIIENQNQNQNQLLNMSGDAALVVLPTYEFSGDQSANFFTFILDSIEEVFLSSDEASLTLPIYGEEIVINSTDFNVLPASFKLFIGGYHWFWVGIMILKDIRKIFENLKNGDFEKIASDDINANLI